jgi:hypothetical protein
MFMLPPVEPIAGETKLIFMVIGNIILLNLDNIILEDDL